MMQVVEKDLKAVSLTIQSELEIFADDTKLYSIIETIHDIAKLQQDLWNMQDWSASWLLNLNFREV